MPPKADAKAKAKAKGKAAAARRPSQAKVQKPGSKKGANVPVEIEIKATLDSALNKGDAPMRVGGIEVTGQHRLSRILVESIVALPFVRGFSKVCLRRISYYPKSPERLGPAPSLSLSPASARSARTKPQSETIQFIQVEETRAEEVDCPSLFLALCLGIEASKPQLIRVGPAELLAEEARELQKYQDAYGISSAQLQQLPEVVNTRHKHSLMVIPLAGGRCLLPPLSEAAVEDINSFTKIFNDAISATDGPDSAGFISLALRGTQHVCCSVLLQPMLRGCTEELINLTQVFTNLEDIMLGKTHPELSVDYYDGLGANAIGVEKEQIDDFRGGPTSDGVPINELNKMVFDLVPGMKQTRPTEFLAWFHSQMQQSGTFWNLKAIYSTTSAAIDFDAVLQDADGHAFLAPCSCNAQFAQLATLRQNADAALDWKYRHVFSRMARWMLSGLLLHSPIQGPGDLKWLRELCMILAGMPEDLSLSLPPPPDAAPLHLRFAWSFVRRCVRCLRWHNPMMVNGKLVHLPQPGLQMVWALLDAAIELVPDEHTKSYPERKRLALWASLCFAIRLAVACKKMDETGWLADRSKLWGRFDDGIDLEGLAAQVYVTRFGVQESWSRDPVSKETRSVFLDDLPWEVIPLVDTEEDVKTEYPEDEDPEASVAWAETVSASEQAALLKANAQELDAAQTALKDLEPSMGRQVRKAWESAKRVVVTGGIGQGKRAISKNAMADLTLAELCTEVSRFPVRLKLADLQNRKDCADAIQDFCSSEPASCAACAWERLPAPPWMGRFNHQVICVDGKILVTGGVSTQTGKHLQDAWISTDGQNWEDLPAAPWPPRSSHQVVWWEDRLILLGGLGDDDRRFRDAWQTTDFGLTWQELPCPKWSGRFGHRCMVLSLAVKAPARPYLVLMGGSGAGNRALKDVWVSDSGGFSWTELEALPCSPRWNFHVANLNQCLWITGGEDENHHCFNDCWVLHGCQWNPKGSGVSASNVSRWKSEATLGEDGWRGPFTAPWSARAQHQVVPFRGQLALFGGYDEKNQVLYDAWVSQDGITWQVLPHFAWAQAAGRAGHQVLTLQDGRSMVFGGLGGGRDVLRSRSLAVVIEDIPPTFAEEEAVVRYLNRLLQEPGHLVMCVTSIPLLERPLQGEEEELNDESVYSLLQRWKFSELHVKPLEETHLRKLCRRWTHGMELSEKVEAEMLLPDNYDLVNSPLMAIMVLRALAPRSRERRDLRHPLTRCQLYEHMFKRIFQSQKAVKAYDDSEFPLLQKQGMATACCELAYEGLGKRSRCIKLHELQAFIASLAGKEVKVEQMERLVKTAHAGQVLLLEDYQQGGLRFRYPSMQDYLAAQCAWVHLVEGKGLPAWLIQENAAGNVSEEVTSCAKFFCLQAEGREPLKKEMLLELREGLAFLLQTMCKAGNALAIRCLLGIAAAGGRQQLMAMHSHSGNHPTGLHLAAIHGHKDVVETLLALAPEPMQLCLAVNSDGMAPLHCAARDGHEATARALLQRAPDGFSLLQMPQKSSSALRPLHWAAKQGHVEVVKCFLEFAPKPAVICVEADSAGNSALHFAAAGGHTVTCHALLSHAGPSNELSDRGILLLSAVNRFDRQTALHIAADRGEKEVVDTLLQGAPDRSALLGMSDKLGQTALHLACERGHGAVVRKLLHSTCDSHLVSARERITGQTALHMAAEAGHNEAVRAILEASPLRETSLATDRGARNTALHLAAERGHLETVKTLVEHCPDTESLLMAQEKFAGQTALHLAAGAGHAELCKVLLELAHTLSSTMLSTQDKSGGFTPLQLACEKGHADVIEILLEGDPDKGARLKESLEKWSGFTALHLVAYRGHEDAARVMLRLAPDKRALLSSKDERGRTAGDLALERGRRNVASLLSES